MNLEELTLKFIYENINDILEQIDEHGCVLGGNNGPYEDNETPIRLSSHWIYILGYLYKKNNDKKYYNYVKKLADYLYDYNFNGVYCYICREKKGKDKINGTIGQAWAIEGLVSASRILLDDKYYELALKLFYSFPYNSKIGCWNRHDTKGNLLGYDETFNHQLWFAAAGSELLMYKDNKKIRQILNNFLDKCCSNTLFKVRKDGLICHYAHVKNSLKDSIRYYKRCIKNSVNGILNKPTMRYKEEGYHYFTLYGFALLKEAFPNHKIFKSKKIVNAVEYAKNPDNYIRQLKNDSWKDVTGLARKISSSCNIYCFPYNSPVYEIPFILKQLDDEKNFDYLALWDVQYNTILQKNNKFSDNVIDKSTLLGRVYELLRFFEGEKNEK